MFGRRFRSTTRVRVWFRLPDPPDPIPMNVACTAGGGAHPKDSIHTSISPMARTAYVWCTACGRLL